MPLREAGLLLGVSRRTLYRMIERGYLHAFKTSEKSWRVTREAVDNFIAGQGTIPMTENPERPRTPRQAFERLLKQIHDQGDVATRVTIKSSDGRDHFLTVQDHIPPETSRIAKAKRPRTHR